jgi:hypothetical protein
MTRRAVGTIAALAVALAAGCGGDGDRLSKAEYEGRLNETGNEIERSFDDLGDAFQGGADQTSLDDAAARIGQIQEQIRSEADELEEVEPPEDAEAEHEQFVEGLNGVADDLGEFRQAVEDGDVQAIQEFGQEFQESEAAKRLEEAGDSLQEKGYNLED